MLLYLTQEVVITFPYRFSLSKNSMYCWKYQSYLCFKTFTVFRILGTFVLHEFKEVHQVTFLTLLTCCLSVQHPSYAPLVYALKKLFLLHKKKLAFYHHLTVSFVIILTTTANSLPIQTLIYLFPGVRKVQTLKHGFLQILLP